MSNSKVFLIQQKILFKENIPPVETVNITVLGNYKIHLESIELIPLSTKLLLLYYFIVVSSSDIVKPTMINSMVGHVKL